MALPPAASSAALRVFVGASEGRGAEWKRSLFPRVSAGAVGWVANGRQRLQGERAGAGRSTRSPGEGRDTRRGGWGQACQVAGGRERLSLALCSRTAARGWAAIAREVGGDTKNGIAGRWGGLNVVRAQPGRCPSLAVEGNLEHGCYRSLQTRAAADKAPFLQRCIRTAILLPIPKGRQNSKMAFLSYTTSLVILSMAGSALYPTIGLSNAFSTKRCRLTTFSVFLILHPQGVHLLQYRIAL